jgi:hypothetical protein
VQLQVKKQFERIGLDRVVVRPPTEGSAGGGFNPFSFGERTKLITPADVRRWRAWPEVQQAIPEVELPWGVTTRLRWKGSAKPVRVAGGSSLRRGPFAEPPTALAGSLDLPESRGSIVLSRGVLKSFKVPSNQYATLLGQTVEVLLEAPRGERQSYRLKVIGVSSDDAPTVQVSSRDRLVMKGDAAGRGCEPGQSSGGPPAQRAVRCPID